MSGYRISKNTEKFKNKYYYIFTIKFIQIICNQFNIKKKTMMKKQVLMMKQHHTNTIKKIERM